MFTMVGSDQMIRCRKTLEKEERDGWDFNQRIMLFKFVQNVFGYQEKSIMRAFCDFLHPGNLCTEQNRIFNGHLNPFTQIVMFMTSMGLLKVVVFE